MERMECKLCGAQVAAGAPRCPECPSTRFTPSVAVTVDTSVADAVVAGLQVKLGEMEAGPELEQPAVTVPPPLIPPRPVVAEE